MKKRMFTITLAALMAVSMMGCAEKKEMDSKAETVQENKTVETVVEAEEMPL